MKSRCQSICKVPTKCLLRAPPPGYYLDGSGDYHGFIFDGNIYTALDMEIEGVTVNGTFAYDIDGSNIVGTYRDGSNDFHGFQAAVVVPLPTSAWMGLTLLGGIGGYGFVRRRIRAH